MWVNILRAIFAGGMLPREVELVSELTGLPGGEM